MSDEKQRKQSRGARERSLSGLSGLGGARSTESYKKDLEKLFKSGVETPERFKNVMKRLEPGEDSPQAERQAAIKALAAVQGFREFSQAVLAFRAEFFEKGWAWPDEEDLLIRMLDHPDERVLCDVLEHIADLTRRQGFERKVAVKSRLGTIETMSEDPRTHRAVAAARDALTR